MNGANGDSTPVVVPLEIRTPEGVTLSELVLEAFYPANDFTAAALRQRGANGVKTTSPVGQTITGRAGRSGRAW